MTAFGTKILVLAILAGSAVAAPPGVFASLSDVQRLDADAMKAAGAVRLAGCTAGSARGGGAFVYRPASELSAMGFAAPDGGIVIAPADHPGSLAAGGLLRQVRSHVTTDMECAASDGKTDDSTKVMAAIDAGALLHKPVFIAPNTVLQNVVLDGLKYPGRYDHMTVTFPFALHGTQGLGGIGLVGTNDVTLSGTMDQQNTLQPQNEHIANIVLLGATNTTLHVDNLNLRGDGLYATDLKNQTGHPSSGIRGDFNCSNRKPDGRNCASFISATDVDIKGNSVLVGGVVGGLHEPGGVDLESNVPGQVVQNLRWTGHFVCGPDAAMCVGGTGVGTYSNVVFNVDVECRITAPKLWCGNFDGFKNSTINMRKSAPASGGRAPTRIIGSALAGTVRTKGPADSVTVNAGANSTLAVTPE